MNQEKKLSEATKANIEAQYGSLVSTLIKDGKDIADNITPLEADLIHSVLGIAGEAGELLDAIKKHTIYKKELDFANIVEELGDLEFYMENLRKALNISRELVLLTNIAKLTKRYPKGAYSNEDAIFRADKA
jgi:NTP pyrophosphatase (non-canonical NTP hydrolase)